MTNSDFSPIEDLNAAITNNNPFKKTAIVRAQDIWTEGFLDVETINAKASNAVFAAIKSVKTSSSPQEKITSLCH